MEWHAGHVWPCQCRCSQNHPKRVCCDMEPVYNFEGHAICQECATASLFPLSVIKQDLVRILFSRTI